MHDVRVILEHGALGICKSSVCTENRGPLCSLQSLFVLLFLVSERRRRLKPAAERRALYTYTATSLPRVPRTATLHQQYCCISFLVAGSRTACCASNARSTSYSCTSTRRLRPRKLYIDFRIFDFLPQRAPLAPLWPLRAPTSTLPSSITRVFAEDQIAAGFGPTGYSDYQNRTGCETACKNPNHKFAL